ncbi:MAG: hypothetical protein COU06_01130 [Candidatus Harrisonbacteria bacterium CG10_big_fil_rev_8_21_14_0_10_38_8]|uniref:Uncharacterized protein n=1 Tax=Candidatus Harrisonbacteria bacterium CG10_big_fil_rev_8_21_14_0_10_38_8 TaxID=1974582 RepID=A0A2M6WK95_9BACT|nr:MAG: hypothetical protein COU06_01130 [Candidatus Harrisonbacteria bacterium CG10_big_fil_rev_8_21_14_0_10_38_8]
MADEIINNGAVNSDGTPNVVPAPNSAEEPTLRTMQSDTANLNAPAEPIGMPLNQVKPEINNAPIFDADEPAFTPETQFSEDPVDSIISQKKSNLVKFMIIILLVIIAGAGIWFFFFRGTPSPVENNDMGDLTPITDNDVIIENNVPVSGFSHFPTGSVSRINLPLTVISLTTIKGGIISQAELFPAGLSEVNLTENGSPVSFKMFLTEYAPTFLESVVTDSFFEDEFTLFVYKNELGIWPGFIANLNTSYDTELFLEWLRAFELSNINEYFLVNPGTFGTAFKDGQVLGINDRYSPGTTAGASLGYLVNDGKFLLSTSFDGMKEALISAKMITINE